MDLFTILIVLVLIIVITIAKQRPDPIKTYNDLLAALNKSYLAAFHNPYNEDATTNHAKAAKNLFDFIDTNSKYLSNKTFDVENKRASTQQTAITNHKTYLDKSAKLRTDVTNTTLLTTWLNDGAALSAHLKASALENASHFAATHVLHIADIRRARYQHALDALKRNPTNPDLHTHALQMGREYAESTRAEGVVTLFDETALANDIRAVTANAAQVSTIDNAQARPIQAASLDERIAALLKLKAAGLLSDAEFEQKRQALIDAV